MRKLFLLFLALGCSGPPGSADPEFWAGTAVVDITPARKVPLGGYGGRQGKPMEGVHDPVLAKALWLETPAARVCLVTTDLIGSTLEIRDRIRPADAAVILAASHNHSGPGALARGMWAFAMGAFDQELLDELVGRLGQAVTQARASRRPARLAFARGEAPGLSHNRRHPGGPTDPEVHILYITDREARPLAVLTNFSAHGTVLSDKNFQVSGDWPGMFQRALESKLGGVALFTNGAEGDQAPSPPSGEDPFLRCRSMGEALAGIVANQVGTIEKTTGEVRMSYVERGVDLPSPTLPLAPRKSVLGLLTINGTRLYCVPGEPCVELGLELKKTFQGSWILGLANDHLGYFLTEEEYQKGGYERKVSFYGPRMGPWLVRQLMELGEREHAQNRPVEPEGGRREDHDRR